MTTLGAVVRERGGLLAETVTDLGPELEEGRPLAVAAVAEGEQVHFRGGGEVVATADPDLGLLAGDALYALGLERLAARGDLEAVAALAEAIATAARAHAEGREEAAREAMRAVARQLAG